MSKSLTTQSTPTYLQLHVSRSTNAEIVSCSSSMPPSPVMILNNDDIAALLCGNLDSDQLSRLNTPQLDLSFVNFLRDNNLNTSPGPSDQILDGGLHFGTTPTNTYSAASTSNHTFASTMTDLHSSSNSPTDFAFAAPNLSHGDGLLGGESKTFNPNMSPPTTQPNFSYQPFNFHAGSSFSSSGSGSAAGASFSSADTSLPAISREFARPSVTETRRPATAGGAFVTRPFNANGAMEPPIMEEGEPTMQELNAAAAARRASESQVPWSNFGDAFSSMSMINPQHQQQHQQQLNQQHHHHQQQQHQQQIFARPANITMRPQTSDGVPMASAGLSLPSTSTITSQIDYRLPYRAGHEVMHNTFPGDRAYSMSGVRPSYISPPSSSNNNGTRIAEDGSLQFVSLGGPAPRKRPRRRYDEIERLYLCGWNGCEKSYGTLNHLNAHVAMQKHGEKRLPQEFKEMRKSWRKRRREENASHAGSQSMQQLAGWNRASMSSSASSDFDRRESSFSQITPSEFGRSNSAYSNYGFTDSRPNTAGSMISMTSTDSRPNTGYATQPVPQWGYGPGNPAARRVSAPTHIPMPQQVPENGFRPVEADHPTPTPQNPFPQMSHNGRQYFQQQTLTAPMPVAQTSQLAGQFDQFAFR